MNASTLSGQILNADNARTTPKAKIIAMYNPRNFKKASSDSSTTVLSASPFAAAMAGESTATVARLVDFPSRRLLFFDLEPNSNGSSLDASDGDDDDDDDDDSSSSFAFVIVAFLLCCSLVVL